MLQGCHRAVLPECVRLEFTAWSRELVEGGWWKRGISEGGRYRGVGAQLDGGEGESEAGEGVEEDDRRGEGEGIRWDVRLVRYVGEGFTSENVAVVAARNIVKMGGG